MFIWRRVTGSISGGKINVIKILFVCHGSILKCSGKAGKMNNFMKEKGAYYTTTTPFLKES
ncbi:MAG: hypothetical protein HDR15_02615 [Lachnospiraceae bacterium]|nr:hypothetical protein [Lachnospiraceae bacterium]